MRIGCLLHRPAIFALLRLHHLSPAGMGPIPTLNRYTNSPVRGVVGTASRRLALGPRHVQALRAAVPRQSRDRRSLQICNVAETTKESEEEETDAKKNGKAPAEAATIKVTVDGASDDKFTTIVVEADNRAGLLTAMTATFRDLGLEVRKADIGGDDTRIQDTFWVVDAEGNKVTAEKDLANIKRAVETILKSRVGGARTEGKKRPKLLTSSVDIPTPQDKKDLLYTLMGMFVVVVGCIRIVYVSCCHRYVHQERRAQHPAEHCQPRGVHHGTQPLALQRL